MSVHSIDLSYTRLSGGVLFSWTLKNISGQVITDNENDVVLISDNEPITGSGSENPPIKQTVYPPGTVEAEVLSDSTYFQLGSTFNFVVVVSSGNNLIMSNQVQATFVKVPTPEVTLTGAVGAFLVNFKHPIKDMTAFRAYEFQTTTGYTDASLNLTNVVVTMTYKDPANQNKLSIIQANYDIAAVRAIAYDSGDANSVKAQLKVGKSGDAFAASSYADLNSSGLANLVDYEVQVAYVSSDAPNSTIGNTGTTLGRSEASTTQVVSTTTALDAPQDLTVVERASTDNGVKVYFKPPDSDSQSGSTLTTIDKYDIYYSATTATSPTAPGVLSDASLNALGWFLAKRVSTDKQNDTRFKVYEVDVDGNGSTAQPVGTKWWYTVRTMRLRIGSESDSADFADDGELYGAFCPPVSFETFVHASIDAPVLSNFATTADVNNITFTAVSPSNINSYVLTNPDYTGQTLEVVYSGVTKTFTPGQIFNTTLTLTALTFGTTYAITSAVYKQKGYYVTITVNGDQTQTIVKNPTTYTSINANNVSNPQIAGQTSVSYTPYTTPAAPTSVVSTGLNNNLPYSTSASNGDGQLKVSWTPINYETSIFKNTIRYRIFNGVNTPQTLVDGTQNLTNVRSDIEEISSSSSVVSSLNIGQSYQMYVQAYFYNTEMNIWVKGATSSMVSAGHVPFYYPSKVGSISLDMSGNSSWSSAANNGVVASSEVEMFYDVVAQENEAGSLTPASNYVSGGSNSYPRLTTTYGNVYKISVTPFYRIIATNTYVSGGTAYTATAYTALPLSPSTSLAPSDNTIVATFTNANNSGYMQFVRFEASISTSLPNEQALASIGNGALTKTFTFSNENGVEHYVKVRAVYIYPAGTGAEFFSEAVTTTGGITSIPFGRPLIVSASVSGNQASVTMRNNGRKLREILTVGIPSTVSSQAIEFNRVTPNADPAVNGDNNVERVITFTFNTSVKEALLVLENDAGSNATLAI
jgi:hypothetical protein